MSHAHHDHTHHAHTAPQSFNKAFAIAVSLNIIFTIVEVIYAVSANSMSLLADAMHNFGDVLGLVLAWGANWLLTLSAQKRYSYGFKRTTILAALTNALFLVITSVFIFIESIYKLLHISVVNEKIVIVIALIGIVINGGTALLFMRGAEHDVNIKAAFFHLLGDAIIALGVVISAAVIYYTGYQWLDPVISLAIIIIIFWNMSGLLRDAFHLILDATPHHIDPIAVENYLVGLPGVTKVHDLHIWGLSTKEIALTAHLVMPNTKLTDKDFRTINHVLRHEYHIHHATLQVESGSEEHPCTLAGNC